MSSRPTRLPFARFLRWLGAMLAIYFIITAILSLTVDPWRINNTALGIDALDASREISGTVRVGKAALANKGDWETVILGSSRMEIAFDPTHPVFAGKKTANLAMSAANVLETVPAGNYLLDRNRGIRTIIFGIEAGDLHNNSDSRKYTRFFESPFADNNRSIERGINQVIGGRSLADSIATIRRHFSNTPTVRSPLGQWLQPNHPGNLREYVESTFQMGFESADDAWALRPQTLYEGKRKLLAEFIARVRKANIRMILVVPPQHALKQIHPKKNTPEKMVWEHDLLVLAEVCREANRLAAPGAPVELWSFLTFNEHTTRAMPEAGAEDQRMEGWVDLGHGQPAIGNLALDTLFSGEPGADPSSPKTGINLLEESMTNLRSDWIAAHVKYCSARPEDVAWWRSLVANAAHKKIASRPMAEEVR